MRIFRPRSGALVTGAAVLALIAGAVSPAHANRPALASNVLVDPLAAQVLWPGTLDPAQVSALTDGDIIQKIYAGLVKQVYSDKTHLFTVVPDLAAAMPTISKDGLTYTFKIRPDAKFSDGKPVTAQDFVWSFQRVLDPKANSGVSYYLYDIKGAADYNAGKSKTFGAVALDASTLQITLTSPIVYFLYEMTYYTYFAVEQNIPVVAPTLTTTPSMVVGAGPWMLKNGTWKYRSEISLVPNPYYHGSKNFKLTEIDIPFTGTNTSMLAAYKSGQYPISWLPSADVASYRGTPEFHDTVVLGDYWLDMNQNIKPFDNIHFRRAVAYAINRDAISNGVDHGTNHPQYSWYPVGILGNDPNVQKQAGVPTYNPTIAKQELALAMKQISSVPTITLEFASENADRAREAASIQSDLKAVGITIGLHPVPRATWIKDGNSGKTQFIYSDWFEDYPDPQDFSAYLIQTGAGENWGRYSNKQVDALIAKGNVERDAATRANIYKQIQLIVLREAPVAMLYQDATQSVISTLIHGMELTPGYGNEPQPIGNDWSNVNIY
jgi:oligopeptide transport system substrate-binding protein